MNFVELLQTLQYNCLKLRLQHFVQRNTVHWVFGNFYIFIKIIQTRKFNLCFSMTKMVLQFHGAISVK